MDNELLLMTGEDIPFIEAQITIHQPTISEISLIGEKDFLTGLQMLNFSKDFISEQDKKGLENTSDFEIFMSIMCSENIDSEYKNAVTMILSLIFPECQIHYTQNDIILINEDFSTRINIENFDIFKTILNTMFGMSDSDISGNHYNPIDTRAEKIAEKLKKRKKKISQIKGEQKVAIFSRYLSILSVGLGIDLNILKGYTIFQLKDGFERFQLKQSNDMYFAMRCAGVEGLDEVDSWLDDIHQKAI